MEAVQGQAMKISSQNEESIEVTIPLNYDEERVLKNVLSTGTLNEE
jgi:hypothetical protein